MIPRRFLPGAARPSPRVSCLDQALDAAAVGGGPARAAAAGEDGETLGGWDWEVLKQQVLGGI